MIATSRWAFGTPEFHSYGAFPRHHPVGIRPSTPIGTILESFVVPCGVLGAEDRGALMVHGQSVGALSNRTEMDRRIG